MNKKDGLDNLLIKAYKMIKGEIIPIKKGCPEEALLWKYRQRGLEEMEKREIEEHLLTCNECMETLKTIGLIIKAEDLPGKIPKRLHKKAEEILENELKRKALSKEKRKITQKITLFWDKFQNRISFLTPRLEGIRIFEGPELNIVREPLKSQGYPGVLLFSTDIDERRGTAFFKLEPSGNERDLTLKILFPPDTQEGVFKVRITLYKSGRIHSSMFLNERGEAFFYRIKEGHYLLEFVEGEKTLKIIKISIHTHSAK